MKKPINFIVMAALLLTSCSSYHPDPISSTVLIHVKVQKGEKRGWGTCSGVYVEKNLILTASHCLGAYDDDIKVKEIWVGKDDGSSARADVVQVSPERDLATLSTKMDGLPVPLAASVRQDMPVEVIGCPLDLDFTITRGIVSKINFRMSPNPTSHFILDAVVLPGNSGGPVFDENGFLIGILVRSTSMLGGFGAAGLGVAVDIHEIRGFLGK
jgi:S1-C subfamily serine protease